MSRNGPSSVRSDRVRALRRLANRSFRDKVSQFLVEGPQGVREAVLNRPDIVVEVFLSEESTAPARAVAGQAQGAGLTVTEVPEQVLLAMTETVTPQGIAAVCRFLDRPATDLWDADGAPGPAVLLHEIRDPGNAGTIARTADAVASAGVVFSAASVDPYNGKCIRSSAGSLFHVPLARGADPLATIEQARASGRVVLATDVRADLALGDPALAQVLEGPLMWVFGNEAAGLPEEIAAAADHRVRIPIAGAAESLNLAVAAAVCLYAPVLARALDSHDEPSGR